MSLSQRYYELQPNARHTLGAGIIKTLGKSPFPSSVTHCVEEALWRVRGQQHSHGAVGCRVSATLAPPPPPGHRGGPSGRREEAFPEGAMLLLSVAGSVWQSRRYVCARCFAYVISHYSAPRCGGCWTPL